MTNRFLALVSGILLLAACETAPGDGSGADGSGAGGYGSGSTAPGTQGDLEKNVGDRVFYGYNSSVLTAEGQATLQRQATWLNEHSSVSVVIEGHCDERGTRAYNLALGERRAAAAKNFLTSLGVNASRVTTVSYGKERPAAVGSDESSWAQNRRAVTVISY